MTSPKKSPVTEDDNAERFRDVVDAMHTFQMLHEHLVEIERMHAHSTRRVSQLSAEVQRLQRENELLRKLAASDSGGVQ